MNMPMSRPIVSVIIPLHNRGDKIANAVNSVLQQSVQDFEIIVVDDGSSDDGRERLMALSDPRITYVYQPKSGANIARNNGIDRAIGRYVAMLDSDDVFLPGHLERSLGVLGRMPGALVFASVIVDRGGGRSFLKPPRPPRRGTDIGEYVMSDIGFVQTSTVVVAAQTARSVRYLDWLQCGQDTDFAVRMAASGVPLTMIEEPGAVWSDVSSGARISAGSRPEHLLGWLEFIAPFVTRRARIGYRGWHIARALALRQRKLAALRYFAIAAASGCYPPVLIPRILGQILLAGPGYRNAADWLLTFRRSRRTAITKGGVQP